MDLPLAISQPVRSARSAVRSTVRNADSVVELARCGNPRVIRTLAAPALRGIVLQRGKLSDHTDMPVTHDAHYDWAYTRDHPALHKLTQAARRGQWDPDSALDWSIEVDPYNLDVALVDETMSPLVELASFRQLPVRRQQEQTGALLAWMLSQFLHGEQGALFVACQLTEAVHWVEGKMYGSTQVMDEGRHVEVFDRYLSRKLEKRYPVNDNLYVVLDALMSDRRWDLKFLGMQILVEGLALGAFGTLRAGTKEPLLRELLRYVITDEARHVHFGVVALGELYRDQLSEVERREREDWAYEMCLLMRSRFLAHEFYDEYWSHAMPRRAWDRFIQGSVYMRRYRETLFRRIIPNLKRIHLLSDRIRPHYEKLGLLRWEHGKAAPELSADELIAEA